jgi:hypothetical protein
MPELSATALFGVVIAGLFFSLGTATVYQANNPLSTSKSGARPPKDYPNIVFGSAFLLFALMLAIFTFRAIFFSP